MLNRTLRILLTAGILFSMLWALPVPSARAGGGGGLDRYVATTGVNSGDCTDSGAPCLTIAYAITQSGPGADLIHIAAGTYYEYPVIDRSVSLLGVQQNLTLIDGGVPPIAPTGGGGLPLITVNSGVVATLRDLNVQNNTGPGHVGGSGGGIMNSGTLYVERVSVSGNKAGSGGGIYNAGSLFLTDVFISGNTAVSGGYGGGLHNTSISAVSLTNVTFSNNTATMLLSAPGATNAPRGGGSIAAGGGIAHQGGNLYLTNVTFSGNTAHQGGAMVVYSGTVNLINSTVINNHKDAVAGASIGGIVNYGSIKIVNTILHANDTANCANIGALISLGHNIDGAATCLTPAIAKTTDRPNTNPLLGPLGKNGGYAPTHKLLSGSPAIDAAAAASCPTTDGASWPRPQDGDGNGVAVCDIGAFEAPALAKFISAAASDGWVLESTETGSAGGSINTSGNIYLGDSALKQQYLGILSFSTGAGLPDAAVITGVTLKVRQQAIIGGGNPVTIFQGFMADVKNGFFDTAAALQTGDFQAAASASYGPFAPAPVGGWYSINLTNGKASINKLATNSGLTQIRLRFKLDDNNNALANYLSLYSGNAPAADRPQLVISYYTP